MTITGRFDIPPAVRKVFDVAMDTKVIDGADLFYLALAYKGRWEPVLEAICDYAHNSRHSPTGIENHKRICKAVDAAYVAAGIGTALHD